MSSLRHTPDPRLAGYLESQGLQASAPRQRPEGGVPADESALDGARREVREETGVEADDWRELCRVHLSNSISDEAGVVFAARAVAHGTATPDPTEDIAVRWIPFDEALDMTRHGRITDSMSIIGLQALAIERATSGRADREDSP